MSDRSDRIQSLIARLDRIFEPASSRDSQLQGSQRAQAHRTLDTIGRDTLSDTVMRTAIDSSVAEVEEKECIEFHGDATRNKPPPPTPASAEFSHPGKI